MNEIAYCIDKMESEKTGGLAVKLVEAARNGFSLVFSASQTPISLAHWQKLATLKDKDALRILSLKDVKFENSCVKIPCSQAIQALKWLAATGKLYFNLETAVQDDKVMQSSTAVSRFNQKQLVCDFFTQVEFYFLVKNNAVQGRLKFQDQDFELSSCDFICQGSNPWFIKGSLLKLIHTEVSWKELKQLYSDPLKFSLENLLSSIDLDPTHPRIVYADNSLEQLKQDQQPFPLLILKDRSGAFADLWMDYGNNKIYPFHETEALAKRDPSAEKNWEKDLLETGFIKKQVGNSHYYCPLDKVSKSIAFLLEIGWNIQDYQNKKVLLLKDSQIDVSMQVKDIVVSGTLRYDNYEADLKDAAGAFNRRERFVQIGHDAVGLLPEKWQQESFSLLFEEGEVVSEGLKFKKHQLGLLENILQDTSNRQSLDESLQKLKAGLLSLSEIPNVKPGATFRGTLRPYQQQGVNWLDFLHRFGFNGLLADDMGLGKTVQVLAFLSLLQDPQPVLIVMPTSLIFNWKKEIERFLPEKKIIVHQGPDRKQNALNIDHAIILTSYAIMRMDLPLLSVIEFSAIILDEAQAIKNSHTQAAQAAYQLKTSFRLLVTGTPIENHLNEIWSHFHFLMPDLLGDEKSFYADLQAGNSDSRYVQRIKRKVRPFVLRRKKIDVAKDLPECVEQSLWIEMAAGQRQIYESYLAGIKNNLFTKISADGISKHRLEVFEAILRLRQICCRPSLDFRSVG